MYWMFLRDLHVHAMPCHSMQRNLNRVFFPFRNYFNLIFAIPSNEQISVFVFIAIGVDVCVCTVHNFFLFSFSLLATNSFNLVSVNFWVTCSDVSEPAPRKLKDILCSIQFCSTCFPLLDTLSIAIDCWIFLCQPHGEHYFYAL